MVTNFSKPAVIYALGISFLLFFSSSIVIGQANIQGSLTYCNDENTPLDGERIFLMSLAGTKQDSSMTNISGSFLFKNVPPGMYIVKPLLKKQWDGVNSSDALLILRHFVQTYTLTGLFVQAADLDNNHFVNSADAFLAMKRFVGQVNAFIVGDWVFETDTIEVLPGSQNNCALKALCFGDVNGSYIPPACSPAPTPANAGPDGLGTIGSSIILQGNTPVSGTGTWMIYSGLWGVIAEPSNPQSVFSGLHGETYRLIWAISTPCYTSHDTMSVSFVFLCGDTVFDARNNKQYPTVQIGAQCWMQKNMDVGVMVNDHIATYMHNHSSNNNIIEKHCYDNYAPNCEIYGGLYDWDEAMQFYYTQKSRGICPPGWHIPSNTEWQNLISSLGGNNVAGGKMKETGLNHWASPNTGATNSSNFTALGAGKRITEGGFTEMNTFGGFWISDALSAYSYAYSLSNTSTGVEYVSQALNRCESVRCLKDNCTSLPTPANAGADQTVNGPQTILDGNSPLSGTGNWSILFGLGGVIQAPGNPNSAFNGQAGNCYTLLWTISTACSYSIDTVRITMTSSPCQGTDTVSYGGKIYHTIPVGTQCWMKENLDIGSFITGQSADNGIIEKHCYKDDLLACGFLGGLYDWNELMQYTSVYGTSGICPSGWHIPTREEWCQLATYLDPGAYCNPNVASSAGNKLKEAGCSHWYCPNTANNISGFTALPGGEGNGTGIYDKTNSDGYYWSSSRTSLNAAACFKLTYNSNNAHTFEPGPSMRYSLRCIKGEGAVAELPAITLNSGIEVTVTSATGSCLIPDDGGSYITERGICYGTISGPDTSGSRILVGSGNTGFGFQITGLTANTKYYVRAYAINDAGLAYSNEVTFISLPLLTTAAGSNFTTTSCTSGGTIDIGTSANIIISRGLCWSTGIYPDIDDDHTVNGSGAGSFISNLSGLGPNTLYHARSFAQTSYGIAYGNDITFATFPEVITDQAYNIDFTSAFLGGEVSEGGGATITLKGLCWSTSPNPTKSGPHLAAGSGLGSFGALVTNLTQGTTYYVRAYATNESGDWYGNEITFTTLILAPPTVSTNPITNISYISANGGGVVVNSNNSSVSSRGICWSTSPGPDISDNHTVDGSGTGTFFSTMSDLQSNTTYYVRAYATNSIGTGYGQELSFETSDPCEGLVYVSYSSQIYPVVAIGTQCWFKRNLNIGNRISGSTNQTNNGIIEKYCYNNSDANCSTYGGLYQWNEMMQYATGPGIKGICPNGWHLPTDGEWSILTTFLGGLSVAGGAMKEILTSHWASPNTGANNFSNFTAFGGGYFSAGSYSGLLTAGAFWSSSENTTMNAWGRFLTNTSASVTRGYDLKTKAVSVRCMKNQ